MITVARSRGTRRPPAHRFRRRTAFLLPLFAAAVVALPASPAAADWPGETRTATVSSDSYEWITGQLYARGGQNLYLRFDRVPEPLNVKWVKCGYRAGSDSASSVGGRAARISGDGYVVVLGRNFKAGTCVRIWARAVEPLDEPAAYPLEAYFDRAPHF